jgi:hypothetical protein
MTLEKLIPLLNKIPPDSKLVKMFGKFEEGNESKEIVIEIHNAKYDPKMNVLILD